MWDWKHTDTLIYFKYQSTAKAALKQQKHKQHNLNGSPETLKCTAINKQNNTKLRGMLICINVTLYPQWVWVLRSTWMGAFLNVYCGGVCYCFISYHIISYIISWLSLCPLTHMLDVSVRVSFNWEAPGMWQALFLSGFLSLQSASQNPSPALCKLWWAVNTDTL